MNLTEVEKRIHLLLLIGMYFFVGCHYHLIPDRSEPFAKDREPEIFEAIHNHNSERVKRLIEAGADLDERSTTLKETPLMAAVSKNNPVIVDLLLSCGVEIDAEGNFGITPLNLCRHSKIGALLIAHGADINYQNKIGKTALHVQSAIGNVQMVNLLLNAGADPNLLDLEGFSPLLYACRFSNSTRNPEDYTEIVKILILKGADVNAANRYRQNPLIFVSRYGRTDLGKLLLEAGAYVNCRDRYNDTPLHIVAVDGYLDFAELLLENGADLGMKNSAGLTPLEAAVRLKPFPGRISRKTNKKAVIDLLHSALERIKWN